MRKYTLLIGQVQIQYSPFEKGGGEAVVLAATTSANITLEKDYTKVFIVNGGRASGGSYCGSCSVTGNPQPTLFFNNVFSMGSMHGGCTAWRIDNAVSGQRITAAPTINGGTIIIGVSGI